MTAPGANSPVATVASLGLLGGAALIATAWLTRRGPAIFVPYGALMGGTLLHLRAEQVAPFGRRYTVAFGAFTVATSLLLAWTVTIGNPDARRKSLRRPGLPLIATMVIGAVLSAAVAHLSGAGARETP
jgi:drug/metabolite transporter superfamily protein YnfA